MKIKCSFIFLYIILSTITKGQSTVDAAVLIEGEVNEAMPSITLKWQKNILATSYTIYRKSAGQTAWKSPIKTLTANDTTFTDENVKVGQIYEYRIDRNGSITGHGYISSGINVELPDNRGGIILLVDSLIENNLSKEISILENDLVADGYFVLKKIVSRSDSVTIVKDVISKIYATDPKNIKSLFIIGHVPVPYSGNINPDGHADHLGAWPTDLYYSDIDGTYTDLSIDSPETIPARTRNIPGDGKFDQSLIFGQIKLQVGRVDFYDMPAFAKSEIELMRDYINKNHAYKNKIFSVEKKAVIDDNFGYFSGEAFAASGWNNFTALCGQKNIIPGDYFETLQNDTISYLWSYGCGGGWYSGAGGIGSTDDFAKSNLNGVFTLLFGSYFGDWDVSNSFLRAPLAQGKMLACTWSGRPHHTMHQMAMGETIGNSLLATINNNNYFPNIYGINGKWIHNSLMGDPTLRGDVISPIQNINATYENENVKINWQASSDSNIAYNVYFKKLGENNYTKINSAPVLNLNYTYNCFPENGQFIFMVKAIKKEVTPSGSYINNSLGRFDTLTIEGVKDVVANFETNIQGSEVKIINNTANGNTFEWSINGQITSNDTNPVFNFDSSGLYSIQLIAQNNCFIDTIIKPINILLSNLQDETNSHLLYPNPTSQYTKISNIDGKSSVKILTIDGKYICSKQVNIDGQIDISNLNNGKYLLSYLLNNGIYISQQLIVIK